MIKIERTQIFGLEAAIRGMRNPMNSWDKSDSCFARLGCDDLVDIHEETVDYGPTENGIAEIGPNDHDLMIRLAKAGSVDAKYRRMIAVYTDITAPLYWWKEFDTYKIGTVADSCSTMHKIHANKFTLEDFSHEHLLDDLDFCFAEGISAGTESISTPNDILEDAISALNLYREKFLETNDKKYWWQMIQLLPSSYNQKWTVMLNYEVLVNIYQHRRNHKLDEWREFCQWIEDLPYSEIITYERCEKC